MPDDFQMRKSGIRPLPEQADKVQYLKLLAGVLLASNIVLGVMSGYLLRTVDRNYSTLIDRTVPTLTHIRSANREASSSFRALIVSLVNDDPETCAHELRQAQDSLAREKQLRAQVLASAILDDKPPLLAEFQEAASAYEQETTDLMGRVTPEMTAEEERTRINQLHLTLERYSIAIGRVSDFVESRSQSISGDYSSETHSRSALMLRLASWPVLAAAVIATLTVALVIITLLVFKRTDFGDGT